MYQSTQMISSSSTERIQGYPIIMSWSLFYIDMFSQTEEKETALPLLQESPGHSLAVADGCSHGGRGHEGEDPDRPWELAWLCLQLLCDLCKSSKSEQRESSHRGMEPGHAGELPDPRSMEISSHKWPQNCPLDRKQGL